MLKDVKLTLKFPKLDKALAKDKDMRADDPRKGIIVLNNNAIVMNYNFCIVIDLMDYFTIDCGIDDDQEIAELKKILFYMDEKVFNKEYWGELTNGANMKMNGDSLFIETPKYSKDLHYKHLEVDLLEPLENIKAVSESDQNLVSTIALPFAAISQIYNVLSADFKGDYIIFEFADQTRPVKFTFRNRKHVYGYIYPHYDAAQEGFKFETMKEFIRDEYVRDVLSELQEKKKKSLAPPPPPPTELIEIPADENQTDMFGGDILSGKSWQRVNMTVVKPDDND